MKIKTPLSTNKASPKSIQLHPLSLSPFFSYILLTQFLKDHRIARFTFTRVFIASFTCLCLHYPHVLRNLFFSSPPPFIMPLLLIYFWVSFSNQKVNALIHYISVLVGDCVLCTPWTVDTTLFYS